MNTQRNLVSSRKIDTVVVSSETIIRRIIRERIHERPVDLLKFSLNELHQNDWRILLELALELMKGRDSALFFSS